MWQILRWCECIKYFIEIFALFHCRYIISQLRIENDQIEKSIFTTIVLGANPKKRKKYCQWWIEWIANYVTYHADYLNWFVAEAITLKGNFKCHKSIVNYWFCLPSYLNQPFFFYSHCALLGILGLAAQANKTEYEYIFYCCCASIEYVLIDFRLPNQQFPSTRVIHIIWFSPAEIHLDNS